MTVPHEDLFRILHPIRSHTVSSLEICLSLFCLILTTDNLQSFPLVVFSSS